MLLNAPTVPASSHPACDRVPYSRPEHHQPIWQIKGDVIWAWWNPSQQINFNFWRRTVHGLNWNELSFTTYRETHLGAAFCIVFEHMCMCVGVGVRQRGGKWMCVREESSCYVLDLVLTTEDILNCVTNPWLHFTILCSNLLENFLWLSC